MYVWLILLLSFIIGVVPTPIHSPLPKDASLSSLTQQSTLFIQRSALQDLQEIGEGMSFMISQRQVYMILRNIIVCHRSIWKDL